MSACDVLVIGEVLVELSSAVPLREARELRLGFSGDALNAAAAARAAGARVRLLTRVGSDEIGDRLLEEVADLGVDATLVRRADAPNGLYFVGADPDGVRDFVYVRRGSAASRLRPEDLDDAVLRSASAVVLSGITQALSSSTAAAVARAAAVVAEAGGIVVYDPNYRRRLTTVAQARAALAAVAPHASVVTPSAPSDIGALLDTTDPFLAAERCRALGARAVAVTCGADGVVLDAGDGAGPLRILPSAAPRIVDATGAGDVFAGTLTARLALGDPLERAVRLGGAAAALSLAGQGGTGRLAPLAEVERHLAESAATEAPAQASADATARLA
ncbi:MAG: hypothetical protein JWQ48_1485 [Conexibacter sp.]|nr:hypothetical protein [Conexibacter sp.]